jgi:hypothetical protein
MLGRLIGGMFGGGARPKAPPPKVEAMPQEQPAAPQAAPFSNDPAEVLRQALAQVESMPRDLADLRRWLGEVFSHLDDVLTRLDREAHRLAETSARLTDVAGRLEDRLHDGLTPANGAPEAGPAPAEEPTFSPNGAIAIVLAAVPGFQGLMDVQRALSSLRQAEGATVLAFKDGEASLEVTLRSPVTARQLVEGLHQATGHTLLIEEVRPEASKLRLRFTEQQAHS